MDITRIEPWWNLNLWAFVGKTPLAQTRIEPWWNLNAGGHVSGHNSYLTRIEPWWNLNSFLKNFDRPVTLN